MQRFYQVVQARVKDGHQESMRALRPRFVAAMQRTFPGLLEAHLVRLDDGTWLDIVAWTSREAAANVEAGHATVPEAIEMAEHIAEVIGVRQGVAVDDPIGVAG